MRLVRATLLSLAFAASSVTLAAPCSGFTDVDDTNPAHAPFCANVGWVKNRGITLGCTSPTLYCPFDNVSRLQMAAFMNRLATALEPTFHYNNGTDFQTDFAIHQFLCPLTVASGSYRRLATIDGRFSFKGLAEFRMAVKLWMSTDGGSTWQDAGTFFHSATVASGHWATLAPLPAIVPMEPGTTYTFSISAGGSTMPSLTELWFCELRARVENRNGLTPPFDN